MNIPEEGYESMAIWYCERAGCDYRINAFATPDRLARAAWLMERDAEVIARMSAEHYAAEHDAASADLH